MTDIVERLRASAIPGCQNCDERLKDEAADEIERLRFNATIERCAQVAEKFYVQGLSTLYGNEIAAAIRALKGK